MASPYRKAIVHAKGNRYQEDKQKLTSPGEISATADCAKHAILAVNGRLHFHSSLKKALGDKFDFYSAICENAALKKLHHIPKPEIIFFELRMPGKDGLSLPDTLPSDKNYKGIAFFFILPDCDNNRQLGCYRKGAIACYCTPFPNIKIQGKINFHR